MQGAVRAAGFQTRALKDLVSEERHLEEETVESRRAEVMG